MKEKIVIPFAEAERNYDYHYPKENQYNLGITTSAWKQMLKNKKIFREKDFWLLQQIYKEDHHSTTCSELGIMNGTSPSSYNSQVVALAKRILKCIGKNPNKRQNGKNKFYDVVFWGQYLPNNHFEWKIKPKLVAAMEQIYPNLMSKTVNEELDNKLNEDLRNYPIIRKRKYGYRKGIDKKPEALESSKGARVYLRNRNIAQNALGIADFKCELNEDHKTFIRKRDGIPYTESHHLIPMEYQDDFNVSIDVEENIISLCSNCHNKIHYGRDAKQLIEMLYNMRKELLNRKGIFISLEQLLKYYNY